jgi:hypothetical protein
MLKYSYLGTAGNRFAGYDDDDDDDDDNDNNNNNNNNNNNTFICNQCASTTAISPVTETAQAT